MFEIFKLKQKTKRIKTPLGRFLFFALLVYSTGCFFWASDNAPSIFEYTLIHNRRAYEYYSEANYEAAENELEKVFELDTGNSESHYIQGLIRYKERDLKGALKSFSISMSINPNDGRYQSNVGLVYDDMGEHEIALRFHLLAIKKEPELAVAHNNIAYTYYFLKDYTLALNHLKKAESLDYPIKSDFVKSVLEAIKEIEEVAVPETPENKKLLISGEKKKVEAISEEKPEAPKETQEKAEKKVEKPVTLPVEKESLIPEEEKKTEESTATTETQKEAEKMEETQEKPMEKEKAEEPPPPLPEKALTTEEEKKAEESTATTETQEPEKAEEAAPSLPEKALTAEEEKKAEESTATTETQEPEKVEETPPITEEKSE